jgi:hypothetical protein
VKLKVGAAQACLLAIQVIAFGAFVLCGDRADAALRARRGLSTYRAWDRASGYALVATGVLWLVGGIHASVRPARASVWLAMLLLPGLFALFVIYKRLAA